MTDELLKELSLILKSLKECGFNPDGYAIHYLLQRLVEALIEEQIHND